MSSPHHQANSNATNGHRNGTHPFPSGFNGAHSNSNNSSAFNNGLATSNAGTTPRHQAYKYKRGASNNNHRGGFNKHGSDGFQRFNAPPPLHTPSQGYPGLQAHHGYGSGNGHGNRIGNGAYGQENDTVLQGGATPFVPGGTKSAPMNEHVKVTTPPPPAPRSVLPHTSGVQPPATPTTPHSPLTTNPFASATGSPYAFSQAKNAQPTGLGTTRQSLQAVVTHHITSIHAHNLARSNHLSSLGSAFHQAAIKEQGHAAQKIRLFDEAIVKMDAALKTSSSEEKHEQQCGALQKLKEVIVHQDRERYHHAVVELSREGMGKLREQELDDIRGMFEGFVGEVKKALDGDSGQEEVAEDKEWEEDEKAAEE